MDLLTTTECSSIHVGSDGIGTVVVMADRVIQSQPTLRWAAITFAIGFAAHGLDHLRRGMSACPPFIMVAGLVQGMAVAAAVVMVLTHRVRAPWAALVVGFASALGFTYAHLLPTFAPGYQDSFISAPHINVTWFSWFTAVAEIGAATIFAIVGMREVRNAGNAVLRRSLRDVHPVG
jgi:cyanate permease